VQILVPLAAGLLIVAIAGAVKIGGGVLLGALLLLSLGAVLPGHAWRSGAIAAAPTLVAGLVRSAGDSLAALALVVALAPILVSAYAAAVKGGAMLVAPAAEAPADGRRRRPFETQAQRGRFLVLAALVLVVAVSWSRNLGAGEVDRAAGRRVEQIRAALAGQTAGSLRQVAPFALTRPDADVPGGPYRSVELGADRFRATAEVRKLAQSRCIHVEVDGAGALTTRIVKGGCG
jgi:hypothetical protein